MRIQGVVSADSSHIDNSETHTHRYSNSDTGMQSDTQLDREERTQIIRHG